MNAPTALYTALCLNKNLSTNNIITLMIRILNQNLIGMSSIEILKFIEDLSKAKYDKMTLEELTNYFKSIIKNVNNDNKDYFGFINNNNEKQYVGSFESIKDVELTNKLTMSSTRENNKIVVFIYTEDNTNNDCIIRFKMEILLD